MKLHIHKFFQQFCASILIIISELPWHWTRLGSQSAFSNQLPVWPQWPGTGNAWTPRGRGWRGSCTLDATWRDSRLRLRGGFPERIDHCRALPKEHIDTNQQTSDWPLSWITLITSLQRNILLRKPWVWHSRGFLLTQTICPGQAHLPQRHRQTTVAQQDDVCCQTTKTAQEQRNNKEL